MNQPAPAIPLPTAVLSLHLPYTSHAQALRGDLIAYLESLAQQGDYLSIPLPFGVKVCFINEASAIEEVLLKQARKVQKPPNVKRVAGGLFGENLFTSDGEVWQMLRSTIQPAFGINRLNAQVDSMVELTQAMTTAWQTGQTLDLVPALMDLTLGITSRTLLGQDLRDSSATPALLSFLELFSDLLLSFPLPLWIPTPKHRAIRRQFQIINRYFTTLVAERRQSGQDRGDVLSLLLQAQAADSSGLLSDQQICNEVSNLFAAGYEVVAHTLAFTVYLLSQHPEVEIQLLQELDQVLGNRSLTAADLPRLAYLEQVIKESMRLLPVTTVVARQVVETIELPAGYRLSKGTLVLISPWTLQRRAEYFPQPLQFRPDRFQSPKTIPRFAYLPFSAGPRICIGNLLAMMQIKVNLAVLLRQFRFTPVPEYQFRPVYRFNTRPQAGLPVLIERRG